MSAESPNPRKTTYATWKQRLSRRTQTPAAGRAPLLHANTPPRPTVSAPPLPKDAAQAFSPAQHDTKAATAGGEEPHAGAATQRHPKAFARYVTLIKPSPTSTPQPRCLRSAHSSTPTTDLFFFSSARTQTEQKWRHMGEEDHDSLPASSRTTPYSFNALHFYCHAVLHRTTASVRKPPHFTSSPDTVGKQPINGREKREPS